MKDIDALLPQLQNSAVCLKNVNADFINLYFGILKDAKDKKEQTALNRVQI